MENGVFSENTFDADLSIVLIDDHLNDGKTQTGSLDVLTGVLSPVESVEDMGYLFRRDTDTVILNGYVDPLFRKRLVCSFTPCLYLDKCFVLGIIYRI